MGCVVSGELRAGGQGEVLAARHVRSSLERGSWGDEAGDEVPNDDYGRGLWRSGCGLEKLIGVFVFGKFEMTVCCLYGY